MSAEQPYDWKRDTGFLAEVIWRERHSTQLCVEPLEFDASDRHNRLAYEMALGWWATELAGPATEGSDRPVNIEMSIHRTYAPPAGVLQISHLALRDIQEINRL